MIALVNIGSLLEYGRPTAVLRRIAGIAHLRRARHEPYAAHWRCCRPYEGPHGKVSRRRYVEDGHRRRCRCYRRAAPQEPKLPTALSLAMRLTSAMFSHTLHHPFRRPSEYATPTLNPYNMVITSSPPSSKSRRCERRLSAQSGRACGVPHQHLLSRHRPQAPQGQRDLLLMTGRKP